MTTADRTCTLVHKFSGIRVSGAHLTPVNWTLKVTYSELRGVEKDINSMTVDEIDEESVAIMATRCMLETWMESFLEDILVTDLYSTDILEAFFSTGLDNTMMTLPRSPADISMVDALCCKLKVISGDYLQIEGVSISSSDDLSIVYQSREAHTRMYQSNDVFDGHFLYELPWWHRNDCDTWDQVKIEDMDSEEVISRISTASTLCSIYNDAYGALAEVYGIGVSGDEGESGINVNMADIWTPTLTK